MILPPSNPIVSIGTILGVKDIAAAVRDTRAPVVGLSPIDEGSAVRGMADQLLSGLGLENSAAGVAEHYGARRHGGYLDGWLVHDADRELVPRVESAGIAARAVPLLMRDREATDAMAVATLDLVEELRA